MSTSSAFDPVSIDGVSGSSAMPQIGQDPGACCRISGCMGQVKIVPAAMGAWRCSRAPWTVRALSGARPARSATAPTVPR